MPLICVCSPKGGVGKTTLAANLAWALARAGSKVLALDFDVQNALRLHFFEQFFRIGVKNFVIAHLNQRGRKSLKTAEQRRNHRVFITLAWSVNLPHAADVLRPGQLKLLPAPGGLLLLRAHPLADRLAA